MDNNTKADEGAFACNTEGRQSGLTKREYFASQALTGIIAYSQGMGTHEMAERAVMLADALIHELNYSASLKK